MAFKEYGRHVAAFKKTGCYKSLTSRILAAASGDTYYGPAEGEYTARWNYGTSRVPCDRENYTMKLCDRIREELYTACSNSKCLITDKATEWFKKQKNMKLHVGENVPEREFCNDKLNFQSPPIHCLDFKPRLRDISKVQPRQPGGTRVSPEFYKLLQQHDQRLRRLYILNGMPIECPKKR